MSKVLFIFSMVMSLNLLAVKPMIVNGKKTNGFAPVVKLKMSSAVAIASNGPHGLCTGTFFKVGYIITAAHCIDKLLMEQLSNRLRYLNTGGSLNFATKTNIYINDEKVARVLEVAIHPEYAKWQELEFNAAGFLSVLDLKVLNKEISINEAMKMLGLYRKSLVDKRSTFEQFDLAIIKVAPKKDDEIFEIRSSGLQVDDDVTMVGYGFSVDKYLTDRLSSSMGAYNSLAYSDELNKAKHLKEASRIREYLSGHLGVKKYGQNKVSSMGEGVLRIIGTTDTAKKSYFSWSKSIYNWEEADGESASVSSGDSGGPLLRRVGESFYIHGIVSTAVTYNDKKQIAVSQTDRKFTVSTYVDLSSSLSRNFIDLVIRD